MIRSHFTREQVIAAIERRGDGCVPVLMHKWWGQGLAERYGPALKALEAAYPDDFCELWYTQPGEAVAPGANPEYRFGYLDYSGAARHSIGESVVLLPDWDDLERFLEHFPDPWEPGNFAQAETENARTGQGRYRLGCFWRLFHEKLWTIRGMENLMLDYYDNMDGLKQLGQRLLTYHKVIVDRYHEMGCDGIFTSDDLGHQHGPLMSPAVFHELYYPLYKDLFTYIHERGMHVFLHSCGDNTLLMDDLADAGLDIFHPVQKGCMDMAETARRYGEKLTFMAGVDVQSLLPRGTPEEVRDEILHMREVFGSPRGGLILAMGNGILADTPLENIRAALDAMCGAQQTCRGQKR